MENKKNYMTPQCIYVELSYDQVLLEDASNEDGDRLPAIELG